MTSAVFDFKAINRRFNRMDQKAEHDRKEAQEAAQSVGWPMFGVAVPFELPDLRHLAADLAGFQAEAGSWDTVESDRAPLVSQSEPNATTLAALEEAKQGLSSLAHPEWPYSNTPHEWRKFKI